MSAGLSGGSLAALSRLLSAYLLSPPERFSDQLEHTAQMESETRVPTVDSLVGSKR